MVLKQIGGSRQRLDQLLVARDLVLSRSQARDLILRGKVQVAGSIARKPSQMLASDVEITLDRADARFVSRAAHKLIAALDAFSFSCDGVRALDVGASTGGFTQVLLERGASEVIAVDVGQRQLDQAIAEDRRVRSLEKTDARRVGSEGLVKADRTALVCDVSFISVTKVLPHVLPLAVDHAWLVVLVKPQFEVGPDHVGKGGIVRDYTRREEAVQTVSDLISGEPGWTVVGQVPAPISGGDGNQEYLIGARRG